MSTARVGSGPRRAIGGPSAEHVWRGAKLVGSATLLAAVYFAAAKLGLSYAFVQKNASPVWPPTGIALSALLAFGPRLWPGILLGSFLVNATTGIPALTALGIGIGNTLEALVGVAMLQRVAFDLSLRRLRDVLAYVVVSLACTTVSATTGIGSLVLSHQIGWESAPRLWTIWWLGDVLGAVVFGPFVLAWKQGLAPAVRTRMGAGLEGAVIVLVLAGVTFAVFRTSAPVAYAVFPTILWAAFRFGLPGATSAVLVVAVIAVVSTSRGHGPFARDTATASLMYAQVFLGLVTVTALVLSATDAERTWAETERARLAAERGALAEAARARRRLELVDRVTDVLIGESLERASIFAAIGRAALPDLADWFVADRVDAPGAMRRVAAGHADAAQAPLVEELLRFPPGPDDLLDSAGTVERGEPRRFAGPFDRERGRRSMEQERLIRAIGLRSFVTVPLVARGHTLGAVTFASAGREYDDDDLVLVRVIVDRAALILDNAHLLEQARRAVELRDEVLAIVAHDLRSPLAIIRACSEQLMRARAQTTNVEAHAETIQRAVSRMQRMIEDLLDYASIDAGSLSLRLSVHEIAPMVEDAVALVRSRAAAKGLRVITELADVPPVSCDQHRIQQVLSNLLENAIKFTDAGGSITLRAEPRGDEVELSVTDTGRGIAQDELPHVFDRFWRAPGAGVRGAGLGLSIAKGIVEAHGGRIGCHSELGVGTTFFFTLRTSPP